jgi:hypothetical protein
MRGEVAVSAETLDEAVVKVRAGGPLPNDAEYLADSFQTDREEAERLNALAVQGSS